MKLSKSITIIVILSFLISSNIYASKISFDGKDSNFSIERLKENERLSEADQIISDLQHNYTNNDEIINNSSNEVINEPETIVLYGYPSNSKKPLGRHIMHMFD